MPTWIDEAEIQASKLGFKSALGDIKYWVWVVENDFPRPWDKAEEDDKKQVLEEVKEFQQKERAWFNDKVIHCGVPHVYKESKGKFTDAILKVPAQALNNFFFVADSLKFMGVEKGFDPSGTGKTTELCAFIIESIKKGQFAYYTTADDLQMAVDNEDIIYEQKAFDWAKNIDVLCVDDVGSERPRFKVNHIERILSHRLDYGKKTVISISCDGDRFLRDYEKISKRLSLFSCVLFRNRAG